MSFSGQRVTTALVLAAGMGNRLDPLTRDIPKCLTPVNGIPIMEHLVSGLIANGFKRLIVVTGHLEHCIRSFLAPYGSCLDLFYIHAHQYRTTNNICSLWMARNAVREPFLLVECDLVFDAGCLRALQQPDRIAIARFKPWMNGTAVTLGQCGRVNRFLDIGGPDSHPHTYKTVNMYSLSTDSWAVVCRELDNAVAGGSTQVYYESVFKILVEKKQLDLTPVFFDDIPWYEIDTPRDLEQAEKLFAGVPRPHIPEARHTGPAPDIFFL